MDGKGKVATLGVIGAWLVACGSTEPRDGGGPDADAAVPTVTRGALTSLVQPSPSDPQACNTTGSFLQFGDTNDADEGAACSATSLCPSANDVCTTGTCSGLVPTGIQDLVFTCSVIPSGGGFQVSVEAYQIAAPDPTFSLTGLFPPRGRDVQHNPNADSTPIPNIQMNMTSTQESLDDANCFAQFVSDNSGVPGTSLPSEADVSVDAYGGRIWVSIFCTSAQNLGMNDGGIRTCETSATVRFENCASQ